MLKNSHNGDIHCTVRAYLEQRVECRVDVSIIKLLGRQTNNDSSWVGLVQPCKVLHHRVAQQKLTSAPTKQEIPNSHKKGCESTSAAQEHKT